MIQNFNILIVDDIADNLTVLGDLLREEGYKVRPVPNGKMALLVAEKEKPDLILLDIMMPEMNGYEVCKLLKERESLRDIPVIFISALNETTDIVKAFNSGGADFITKPFMAEEVKARVSIHLKLYQQHKELEKLNADKNRFITILAHDLKSPFVGIIGFSELLATNVRNYDIDKIEKLVDIIHKSSQHFYSLLEDLLIWARAQSGKLPFEPKPIEFLALCNEVVTVQKISSDNKNILLRVDVQPELTVYADLNMLKTILRNLISNAIKYTNVFGKIIVKAELVESEVIISIKDNGIGMSKKTLDTLFDMTQIQSIRGTNDETGTGFGLMLCKEFAEKQGGRIWVESEEEKGTTVNFTLPLH